MMLSVIASDACRMPDIYFSLHLMLRCRAHEQPQSEVKVVDTTQPLHKCFFCHVYILLLWQRSTNSALKNFRKLVPT